MTLHVHRCWCSDTYPGCERILHNGGRHCVICLRPMKNATELTADVYLEACADIWAAS